VHKESLMLVVAASMVSSCARHVPEPAVVMPGTPHVSWVIMHGDVDNPDREFACQSEPRTECVVPASRPDDTVLSEVHIYYHGAGNETKYEGSVRLGFFDGADVSHTLNTNIVVKKTERIGNQSVSDVVTSKPGTYPIEFDMVATVTGTKTTQPIKERINIVVR
jgi:hypothetical protein